MIKPIRTVTFKASDVNEALNRGASLLDATKEAINKLTDAHWRLLNTCGTEALREYRASGELPDCPEVNARIAERCLWDNPNNYHYGRWFRGEYSNTQFRNGPVRIRKATFPDDSVRYIVVGSSGRWCDSFTEEVAKQHLKANRSRHGKLDYLNDQECKEAENDHNWALSR